MAFAERQSRAAVNGRHLCCDMAEFQDQSSGAVSLLYAWNEGKLWWPNSLTNLRSKTAGIVQS